VDTAKLTALPMAPWSTKGKEARRSPSGLKEALKSSLMVTSTNPRTLQHWLNLFKTLYGDLFTAPNHSQCKYMKLRARLTPIYSLTPATTVLGFNSTIALLMLTLSCTIFSSTKSTIESFLKGITMCPKKLQPMRLKVD